MNQEHFDDWEHIEPMRKRNEGFEKTASAKKKKRFVGKHILLAVFYLTLAVFAIAVGTVVYVWVNQKLNDKVNENPAVSVEAVSDQIKSPAIYTQEQMDELRRTLLQEEEQKLILAEQSGRDSVLNEIRAGLEESSTAIETIRPLFPDFIVVANDGRYHFVPILESLQKNNYLQENLEKLESGELRYLENGEVVSHKGIDVSSHQGTIDWSGVAEDGVEFAIIRSAYRGYGSGVLVEDSIFETNVSEAKKAGIEVGLYVFSQAIDEQEILEEAQMILAQAEKMEVDGPLVIDVEKVSDPAGRMNLISVEERTHLVRLFCETVENAGYKPMIYHNTTMGAIMIDLSELEPYEKWFASYSDKLYYPYQYTIWQYSASGTVNGIKGDVDTNISFTKFWE